MTKLGADQRVERRGPGAEPERAADHGIAPDADQHGIRILESVECRDNRAAIALEKEMGFTTTGCPGDATLTLVRKTLT